jgi:hypothetical protein
VRRILVTGSRTWQDRATVWADLDAQREHGAFVLVHGACPTGADAAAAAWARYRGNLVEPHPANWSALGRRAGPIRNAEMVKAGADLCLAYCIGASAGTMGCVKLAEQAGIPVTMDWRAMP